MSFDDFFSDMDDVMHDNPMPIHTEEEQRRMAFQRASEAYTEQFEAAYARRMEQRKADTRQWIKMSLPKILEEARIRIYERELALKHHATA